MPDWSTVEDVLFWVSIDNRDNTYTVIGTDRWATTQLNDPASYHGGPKEARLLDIGVITRALSDSEGALSSSTFSFIVADDDYTIRARIGGTTNNILQNRIATIYAVTNADRLAGNPPTVLARGFIRGTKALKGLRFEYRCVDILSALTHFPQDVHVPRRQYDENRLIGLPPALIGLAEPNVFGNLANGVTGAVPGVYIGTETIAGVEWRRILIAAHACKGVDHWYYVQNPNPIEVDQGETTDFLIPGQAGYIAAIGAATYRDIGGRRYTIAYARGPKGDALAAGSATMGFDVRGIETAGDGSGTLLEDGFDFFYHFLEQFGIQDAQLGWLSALTFAPQDPGLTRIDATSFATCKALAQTRVTGGYAGAMYINERLPLREWIKRFNQSLDSDIGFADNFQMFCSLVDLSPGAIAAATHYDDVADIEKGSLTPPEPDIDKYFNTLYYSFNRDYRVNLWQEDNRQLRDEESFIGAGSLEFAAPKRLNYIARALPFARNVIAHELSRTAVAPVTVKFNLIDMRGMDHQVGDLLMVSHYEGADASGAGYVERLMRIRKVFIYPMQRKSGFECEDAQNYLAAPVDVIIATNVPRCRVYRPSSEPNQTIPNNAYTSLQFTAEEFDYGGMHTLVLSPTRATVPPNGNGVYAITGQCGWVGAAGGIRALRILKNGVQELAHEETAPSTAQPITHQVRYMGFLLAGDYVELQALQNTGASLDIIAAQDVQIMQVAKLPTSNAVYLP